MLKTLNFGWIGKRDSMKTNLNFLIDQPPIELESLILKNITTQKSPNAVTLFLKELVPFLRNIKNN
jgi:hypothetical protein